MKRSARFFVGLIIAGTMIFGGGSVGCHQAEKGKTDVGPSPTGSPSNEKMSKPASNQNLNSLDLSRNEWYSKHLKAMNEPPFFSLEGQGESYRFLWLRTFHHPITIRVWQTGQERTLVFKELNGAGGYEPGKLIVDQSRQLTADEWEKFLTLLNRASFWQLPADSNDSGNDGAQWILEGRKDGKNHLVDHWTPESGNYREACLYLLNLSGREIKDIY